MARGEEANLQGFGGFCLGRGFLQNPKVESLEKRSKPSREFEEKSNKVVCLSLLVTGSAPKVLVQEILGLIRKVWDGFGRSLMPLI